MILIGTVLGVHGIGARTQREPAMVRPLIDVVSRFAPAFTTTFCRWGDVCGAELLAGGASLPPADLGGPLTGVGPWSLDDDPLIEVRFMATVSGGRRDGRPPPRQRPASQVLTERVRAVATDVDVAAIAESIGLGGAIPGSVGVVLAAQETDKALANAAELGKELHEVLARAIVATAVVRAGVPGAPLPIAGGRTRALEALITDRLGGPPGLGPGRLLAGLAASAASLWTERRRDDLTLGATRYLGDVARYLVDGDRLRDMIRTEIEAATPPVVVVAHSLGGVACVELLAEVDLPVDTLITVGSQAPYLFEIDALPTLRFGTPLRRDFPTWINVLDRRDLLAFAAHGFFGGHAVDRVVDNGAPFPRAHSAYFDNEEFHQILGKVLT